jgi:hypothetical protein
VSRLQEVNDLVVACGTSACNSRSWGADFYKRPTPSPLPSHFLARRGAPVRTFVIIESPVTMRRTHQGISMLRYEWPLLVSIATTAVFLVFGKGWLADLSSAAWFALMLGWLFGAILVSTFAVVRHAEGLAIRPGNLFGTLASPCRLRDQPSLHCACRSRRFTCGGTDPVSQIPRRRPRGSG